MKKVFLLGVFVLCLGGQVFSAEKEIKQETNYERDHQKYKILQKAEKSTTIAFILSAVMPGAGNVYAGNFTNAIIAWGLYIYGKTNYYDNNTMGNILTFSYLYGMVSSHRDVKKYNDNMRSLFSKKFSYDINYVRLENRNYKFLITCSRSFN